MLNLSRQVATRGSSLVIRKSWGRGGPDQRTWRRISQLATDQPDTDIPYTYQKSDFEYPNLNTLQILNVQIQIRTINYPYKVLTLLGRGDSSFHSYLLLLVIRVLVEL